MAVLPTPGSPISTGLFFVRRESTWMMRRISSSRPITGSIFPARARVGEIAAVLLEGLVLLLGVVARDAVRAAHLAERVEYGVAGDAERAHEVADAAGDVGHREQQVLGRQVLVVELLALFVGRLEDRERRAREPRVAHRRAGYLRQPRRCFVDPAAHRADIDPDALEDAAHDAFGLIQQCAQQVLGRDLGVARIARRRPARRRSPPGSCG